MAAVEIRRESYAAPAVQALVSGLAEELRGRYDGRDGPGGTPTPSEFEAPNGVFLVGVEDGCPVACGGVCRWKGRTGEIRHMYVAPDARRRGLARAILAALEEEARALGYDSVRLETGERQPDAMRFYESAGFERIACYGPYEGMPLSVCFEKRFRGDAA